MKRLLLIIILFCIAKPVFSQNLNENTFSGGMLILQPGYTFAENNHQTIKDISFGVGGILRFYFLGYFTAGVYGGVQKTSYHSFNSKNSYINLSYGGPFVGLSHRTGKFRYTLSAFVGIGSVKNLHVENQNSDMLTDAYLYKNSATVLSPILSLDYALTQRLFLTAQTVCLTTKFDSKTLYNPTFQIGILFNGK